MHGVETFTVWSIVAYVGVRLAATTVDVLSRWRSGNW
jgi:hypothetical protein